jgi:hypothetical protein
MIGQPCTGATIATKLGQASLAVGDAASRLLLRYVCSGGEIGLARSIRVSITSTSMLVLEHYHGNRNSYLLIPSSVLVR